MCPCEECIVKAMCSITSRNREDCPELDKWFGWEMIRKHYKDNKEYYSQILLDQFKNHTIFPVLYKSQKGES